ncbi:uncharacterized protein LOC144744357 [Ciona intestinalis]
MVRTSNYGVTVMRATLGIILVCLSFPALCKACPTVCECTNNLVNCSNRELMDIPSGIPSTTVTLLLDHNKLSHLQYPNYFNYLSLKSLSVLDLSYNQIGSLQNRQFAKLQALTYLHLSHNRITVPQNVTDPFGGVCRTLRRLDVSHNKFSGEISRRIFGSCQSLFHLDFSHNLFTNVASRAFPSNLRSLNMSFNGVSILSTSLLGLHSLRVLEYKGCQMSSLAHPYLINSPNLDTLRISAPRLSVLASNFLTGLNSLKTLEITEAYKLSSIADHFLSRVPSLRYLTIKHSPLKKLPEIFFSRTARIRRITLNENQLKENDFLLKTPHQFPNLEHLSLKSNNFSQFHFPMHLFPQLRSIDLSNNYITQVMHEMTSSSLIAIDLSNNSIASISPTLFLNCSALQKVDISGNKVTHFPPITVDRNNTNHTIDWLVKDNPWTCDCEQLKTYQYLLNNTWLNVSCGNTDETPYEPCIVCTTPEFVEGKSLSERYDHANLDFCRRNGFKSRLFEPDDTTTLDYKIIILAGAAGFVSIMFIIALLCFLRCKRIKKRKYSSTTGETTLPITNSDEHVRERNSYTSTTQVGIYNIDTTETKNKERPLPLVDNVFEDDHEYNVIDSAEQVYCLCDNEVSDNLNNEDIMDASHPYQHYQSPTSLNMITPLTDTTYIDNTNPYHVPKSLSISSPPLVNIGGENEPHYQIPRMSTSSGSYQEMSVAEKRVSAIEIYILPETTPQQGTRFLKRHKRTPSPPLENKSAIPSSNIIFREGSYMELN